VKVGRKANYKFFGSVLGFSLKGTMPPLHPRSSGFVNWLVWELIEGPGFSVFDSNKIFVHLTLELTLPFIQIKNL